ncbi:MAG: hypothetical protein KC493_12065 [Bacteriovoracaceae bacterium]|nr:hypothetical protein [Bacteriovoracaceae bacterium]
MKHLSTLLILVLIFASCAKEEIQPLAAPVSYVDQRGGKPIVIDYPIRNLEVDRVGNDIGDVPVVGGVFQRLAEVLADISIETDSGIDGMEVPIEPQVFNVAELDEVDFDYIKSISLEGVRLIVADTLNESESVDDETLKGLNFINKIQIFMEVDQAPDNQDEVDRVSDETDNRVVSGSVNDDQADEDEEEIFDIYNGTVDNRNNNDELDSDTTVHRNVTDIRSENRNTVNEASNDNAQPRNPNNLLVLSYNKKKDSGACTGDCINMKVHNLNWKKILMSNRKFTIKVKLFIEQVPKESLKLDGHIRFSVGLNPGLL